jgi:uncharacterized protein YunC (DUF1805 family)
LEHGFVWCWNLAVVATNVNKDIAKQLAGVEGKGFKKK